MRLFTNKHTTVAQQFGLFYLKKLTFVFSKINYNKLYSQCFLLYYCNKINADLGEHKRRLSKKHLIVVCCSEGCEQKQSLRDSFI